MPLSTPSEVTSAFATLNKRAKISLNQLTAHGRLPTLSYQPLIAGAMNWGVFRPAVSCFMLLWLYLRCSCSFSLERSVGVLRWSFRLNLRSGWLAGWLVCTRERYAIRKMCDPVICDKRNDFIFFRVFHFRNNWSSYFSILCCFTIANGVIFKGWLFAYYFL